MNIFSNPASAGRKYFKSATNSVNASRKDATGAIGSGTSRAAKTLNDAMKYTKTQGVPTTTMSGTGGGLSGSIEDGNVNFDRSAETQGWIDKLTSGLSKDEGSYDSLLSSISNLGELPTKSLESARDKAVGDLRSQLALRRVLGASFANSQLDSLAEDYNNKITEAKYQAEVDKLKMTNQVINDRATNRQNTIKEGLDQVNYETGVKATLMANTQNNMMKVTDALTDMAKTLAGLYSAGGVATGDVIAQFANTNANTYNNQAQLEAEGKQSQNNSYGSLLGSLLGFGTSYFAGKRGDFGGGGATSSYK